MCALTTPKDFIVRANAHKILTLLMQTSQMTQATSFLETKPKTIIDIGCDHLASNMAIIFSIHALHLRRLVRNQKHKGQFEKDISIESS
jgi:hypothetical protein